MKKIIILCAVSFLCLSCSNSIFQRKHPSRKQLTAQVDSLKATVDSMQLILDGGTIDMVGDFDDSALNPGSIDLYAEGEFSAKAGDLSLDSVINSWYVQKNLIFSNIEDPLSLDSVRFESDVPDSVYIERLKRMNSFIQLPYNDIVRKHIIYYTTKIRGNMSRVLGLCPYYMPMIEEVMDRYGLPKELKAMAVIESALNPTAVSWAKAKGMWQFMYSTGRHYGLEITSYVDERLDPVTATDAAARYLRDAYDIFGSWPLAIASYNCGAGNVNKAIRRAGSSEFWDIYPFLPRETRGYVPAFVAALYTLKYSNEHGIYPEAANLPVHIDTFKINRNLHFEQVSQVVGVPEDIIECLNPQYLHHIIPGVEHEYVLRIPYEFSGVFIENEDSVYNYKDSVYFSPLNVEKMKKGISTTAKRVVHTVRSGETLGGIAVKYKVKVRDIQGWNNLRGTMIRKGQRLVIYPKGSYQPPVSSGSSSGSKITHVVRSGETLGGIALKYGVSVAKVRQWNKIKGDMIQKGQRLVIYSGKGGGSSAPATSVQGGYVMYTVKSGDTLWEIAKKFSGVSVNDIMKLNNLNKNSKIYPGKKLKIKRK